MIAKEIDKITDADLQSLIANVVSEGKTIEYKQSLQIDQDNEKKEFLADVSSFANASGGDLIIGITEKDDNPVALVGIDIDGDGLLKLNSIIREGIEPRLPSVVIQPIKLSNSKTVLVIRVAKSWLSPHRVSFKAWDRFYSRISNGKYRLDVSELRNAFLYTSSLTDKIKRFKEDRISKIYANETPVIMRSSTKLILHILPLISFNSSPRYEIDKHESSLRTGLEPLQDSGWNHRYNFDGFVTYDGQDSGASNSYTQLYRNGMIEAVLSGQIGFQHKIPSKYLEARLIRCFQKYVDLMRGIAIDLPYVVFLTLVGVKDCNLWVDGGDANYKIDRDILQLPEVMIESYNNAPHTVLRPCFDGLWNAWGYTKSWDYDENGNWKG